MFVHIFSLYVAWAIFTLCENQEENKHKLLIMPTLGRTAYLGDLYDAKNDRFVTGPQLWDVKALNAANTRKHHFTFLKVVTDDTYHNKMVSLNVQASLQISVLGGKIDVRGSAKYIHDKLKQSNKVRISMVYKTLSHYKQLRFDQMYTRKNQQDVEKIKKTSATHVVTKVMYGANAAFVFDLESRESRENSHLQGQLSAHVNLVVASISGSGHIDKKSDEILKEVKIRCRYYGDLRPKKNPATYQEAKSVFQDLPKAINVNTTIPVKLWLMPLEMLNIRKEDGEKLVEIEQDIVETIKSKLDALDDAYAEINSLMTTTPARSLSTLNNELFSFRNAIHGLRLLLKRKMFKLIPEIKVGNSGTLNEFRNITHNADLSQFADEEMEAFIDAKKREVGVLKSLFDADPPLATKPGQFESLKFDPKFIYLVNLHINLYCRSSPYIEMMQEFLKTLNLKCITQDGVFSWVQQLNASSFPSFYSSFALFTKLRDTDKVNFAITEQKFRSCKKVQNVGRGKTCLNNITETKPKDPPSLAIQVYRNGYMLSEDLEPPQSLLGGDKAPNWVKQTTQDTREKKDRPIILIVRERKGGKLFKNCEGLYIFRDIYEGYVRIFNKEMNSTNANENRYLIKDSTISNGNVWYILPELPEDDTDREFTHQWFFKYTDISANYNDTLWPSEKKHWNASMGADENSSQIRVYRLNSKEF